MPTISMSRKHARLGPSVTHRCRNQENQAGHLGQPAIDVLPQDWSVKVSIVNSWAQANEAARAKGMFASCSWRKCEAGNSSLAPRCQTPNSAWDWMEDQPKRHARIHSTLPGPGACPCLASVACLVPLSSPRPSRRHTEDMLRGM